MPTNCIAGCTFIWHHASDYTEYWRASGHTSTTCREGSDASGHRVVRSQARLCVPFSVATGAPANRLLVKIDRVRIDLWGCWLLLHNRGLCPPETPISLVSANHERGAWWPCHQVLCHTVIERHRETSRTFLQMASCTSLHLVTWVVWSSKRVGVLCNKDGYTRINIGYDSRIASSYRAARVRLY